MSNKKQHLASIRAADATNDAHAAVRNALASKEPADISAAIILIDAEGQAAGTGRACLREVRQGQPK